LTDGQGRTVDFRNTVIIMTSNIGIHHIMEMVGEEQIRDGVLSALRNHFRPEFLNRVDEIVIFHRLEKEQLHEILSIQLEQVRALLTRRHVTVNLSPSAANLLVDEGYDPIYGARPLKRVLQRRIIDPMALKLIEGDIRDGDHVVVDNRNETLTFDVVETIEEAETIPA
jgi:ATP-dependent Clp protease ATP-binding subunit ClpB